MLIVASSHYDFASVRRARNICIRLINKGRKIALIYRLITMNAWRHEWTINVKDTLPCIEFCKIDLERISFSIKEKLRTINLQLLNALNTNQHLIMEV